MTADRLEYNPPDEMKPFRTDLDPLIVSELLVQGWAMFVAETDEEPTLKRVIWRLIQEAVECDRAIRRPHPRVKTRSGPEVYYTPSEIWATELAWANDNIVYPPRFIREQPSPAAMARYEHVMKWFRFITSKSKQKRLFVRMLIALASGMPPAKAADAFRELHYRNGDAVWAARNRALIQIETRLKQALKKSPL